LGLFCGNQLIYCLDTRRPQTQVGRVLSPRGGLPKPPKNPLKPPLFRGPKQGVLGPFLGGFWALFETLGGHPGTGGVPWGDTPGLGGYPGGTPRVWGVLEISPMVCPNPTNPEIHLIRISDIGIVDNLRVVQKVIGVHVGLECSCIHDSQNLCQALKFIKTKFWPYHNFASGSFSQMLVGVELVVG
jgi:hypothetical protein